MPKIALSYVSALFRTGARKHDESYFLSRAEALSESLFSPLWVFVDAHSHQALLKLNSSNLCLLRVDNPRHFVPYEKLLGVNQHVIDPEKHIHNTNLYATWHAKPFLVKHFILKHLRDDDDMRSDIIWLDIAFPPLKQAKTALSRLSKVEDDNNVRFPLIDPFSAKDFGFADCGFDFSSGEPRIAGGFAHGTKSAWLELCDRLEGLADDVDWQRQFFGKEQNFLTYGFLCGRLNIVPVISLPRPGSCNAWFRLPDSLGTIASADWPSLTARAFAADRYLRRIAAGVKKLPRAIVSFLILLWQSRNLRPINFRFKWTLSEGLKVLTVAYRCLDVQDLVVRNPQGFNVEIGRYEVYAAACALANGSVSEAAALYEAFVCRHWSLEIDEAQARFQRFRQQFEEYQRNSHGVPPLIVQPLLWPEGGGGRGRWRVVDGSHRAAIAAALGDTRVPCEVTL